jgi:hypothetical protein
MGGNALKNCTARRYEADEYFALATEVREMLRDGFIHADGYTRRVEVVKAYHSKDSFGDLDVIFESDRLPHNFAEHLKRLFNPKEMVPNGKVYSLEYKEFQIDVILTPTSEFAFARTYYAFNDLGNLMGRIAHKFGLKYGHDGLWYMYRDGTHLVDELNVTMNVEDVFRVFDFDYSRWCEGFDTLEDVFQFVAKSKYFNPDIYLFDQMNHRSRVRDAKRATYNKFLEWCALHRETTWKDRKFYQFKPRKQDNLPWLFNQFPGFRDKWFDAYHKKLENADMRTKFNGDLVSEWTGFTDKMLGAFMKDLRNHFGTTEEFRTFVAAASPEMIRDYVTEELQTWTFDG